MDDELQQVFNLMISRGINLFDTADSYGAGRLSAAAACRAATMSAAADRLGSGNHLQATAAR